MNIIRRPIQWINYPTIGFVLIGGRTFFRNKPSLGQQGRESFDQSYLRFLINIRYIIVRVLLYHTFTMEFFTLFFQKMPGLGSYAAYFNCKLL